MLTERLKLLLTSDLSALRFVMSFVALFMGLGLMFSTTANHNYDMLNQMATQQVWALMFLSHAAFLMASALGGIRYCFIVIGGAFGTAIWTNLFLSFTVFDKTPVASTEWLLLIPVLVDIWLTTERPARRIQKEQAILSCSKSNKD
jgi:hypothetical protein